MKMGDAYYRTNGVNYHFGASDSGRRRYLSVDIANPGPGPDSGNWELDGDPVWTDYEGDTPYADSTMSTSTYALTQVNRFFGLAGEKHTSTSDESYRQGDLIGSTMATTDEDGAAAVLPLSYTAFGELLDSNGKPGGAAPNGMPRYQYAGKWGYEAELIELEGADPNLAPISLQHLGWRWYQPDIGRFVQRDPKGLLAGLNSYLYVGGRPAVAVDPSGLIDIGSLVKILETLGKWGGESAFGHGARAGAAALGAGSEAAAIILIPLAGWELGQGIVWATPIEDIFGNIIAYVCIGYLDPDLPPTNDPMPPGYPWGPTTLPRPGEPAPPFGAGPMCGGNGKPTRFY